MPAGTGLLPGSPEKGLLPWGRGFAGLLCDRETPVGVTGWCLGPVLALMCPWCLSDLVFLLSFSAGATRPKPPVRPKPRVLPKPAVPAKPSLPVPGPRHPCPELPSAEKINRLAGPQPYGAHSSGGPLRRPSFTVKSPETHNGKGLMSPPASEGLAPAPDEQLPSTPPTSSRKGSASFKVTPVPVAIKPERFPGTTVEEILAKMDTREGPGNPDRARLSPFCSDLSPRFGSKTFTAFRRCPSGEADVASSEAPRTPPRVTGELGTAGDGCSVTETR